MRLPNADRAMVDEAKIREYLLSTKHPVGRFKAAFFRALGYTPENWRDLQVALTEHAMGGDAVLDEVMDHGTKFRIRAMLRGTGDRSAALVSVWIIRPGESVPRFVTAFPGVIR